MSDTGAVNTQKVLKTKRVTLFGVKLTNVAYILIVYFVCVGVLFACIITNNKGVAQSLYT